ncbi:MAG: hypothetical protein ABEJ58_09275 [Halodesulfurarchaeum sp.]
MAKKTRSGTAECRAVYDRNTPTEMAVVDRWDGGVGWVAHPDETGVRASHAVESKDGVWIFDPLWAPGAFDLVSTLGTVAGVVVLSDWHTRDAARFSREFDCPVQYPSWLRRVGNRLDVPTEREDHRLGESAFVLGRVDGLFPWNEGVAYRPADGTVISADVLGTGPVHCAPSERLGVVLAARLWPPSDAFAGISPDRILVGHGTGVFDHAEEALEDALEGARRRLPSAIRYSLLPQLRSGFEALTG